jgi:hypothetical protein
MQPNDWISFTKKLLFFMTSMALGEIFADQAPKSCIMQKKKKKKKRNLHSTHHPGAKI